MIRVPVEAERSTKSAVEGTERALVVYQLFRKSMLRNMERRLWGQKYAGDFRFGEESRE